MASKTGRNESLVLALARGLNVRSAAKVSGYSERQAHRKLDDPAFRIRVSNVRSEVVGQAVGILAAAGAEAARTLRKLLASPADQVKLAAARSILEVGNKLRETTELAKRIEAIERRQEQQQTKSASSGRTMGIATRN